MINHLIGLGKVFDKKELNILITLTTTTLFEKFTKHELKINRLKDLENVERKTKSLALKKHCIGRK